MVELDVEGFDGALRAALRDDAAQVRTPTVASVVARGRRRQRRRAGALAIGAVAVVLLAVIVVPGAGGSAPERLAGASSPLVLDEGSDPEGPWRLVWTAGDRCLTFIRSNGEGGACGLADPPDPQETVLRVVHDGGSPQTVFAGLVPDGTTAVTVPRASGDPVSAEVVRSGDATLFVARLPGVTDVVAFTASDGNGDVLASFNALGSLPPPVPGQSLPPAPGARGYVEAAWALRSVSEDRRSLVISVHAVAGGCTGPESVQALDMPEGLRLVVQVEVPLTPDPCPARLEPLLVGVDLPRSLSAGEPVLGECVPDDATPDGQTCRELRVGQPG